MTDAKIPFLKLYERRSKSTGLTYFSREARGIAARDFP